MVTPSGDSVVAVWLTARTHTMTVPGGLIPRAAVASVTAKETRGMYSPQELDSELSEYLGELLRAIQQSIGVVEDLNRDLKGRMYSPLDHLPVKSFSSRKTSKVYVLSFREDEAAAELRNGGYRPAYLEETRDISSWPALDRVAH